MADKLASGYQPWKYENLCLSILGLVHKSGNWVSWFSALQILYIHLPFTVDKGRASILTQEMRVPKKKIRAKQ